MKLVLLVSAVFIIGAAQAMPAGAATASVGPPNSFDQVTIHYVADPGETNDVSFQFGPSFDSIEITDSGSTISAGSGCSSVNPNTVRCDAMDEPPLINASLGDGNDLLLISRGLQTAGGRLRGGGGDDRIRGNDFSGTHEQLIGGPGDDSLFGRGGTDFLDGGLGSDEMSGGTSCFGLTAGLCIIDIDTVSYAKRTKNVLADADDHDLDDGQRFEGDTIFADVERLVGGRGNDRLAGSTTNLFFVDGPRLGGMQLQGRRGDDVLIGTRGTDNLAGGTGNDNLRGAGRNDLLQGMKGDDRLLGGPGTDQLVGARGRDLLLANDGQLDRVGGGQGRDKARVDLGLDHVQSIEELL